MNTTIETETTEATETTIEESIIESVSEAEIPEVELDPYYTNENIGLDKILSAKNDEVKQKLVALLNKFAKGDLKEIAGDERRYFINLMQGLKIVGDSNVRHFDYYQVLEKEYYHPFPGKDLKYQAEHVEEYVDENTKAIIFWNGYNIAYYKEASEYLAAYQKLIDSVKEKNPNTEVYVCSLMPATDEAIQRDLVGDLVHHIYRGKEYDAALKEYLGDNYIDIKFIGKKHYYGSDGIHFMPQFYYMLVPYIAYYLNLAVE